MEVFKLQFGSAVNFSKPLCQLHNFYREIFKAVLILKQVILENLAVQKSNKSIYLHTKYKRKR